ncbi:hypothetical protein yc1106_07599 [Curvularia clavata]|uniref:Uncharacterized protein n=1 Tax=Curvularia clavata TaxID=95742 RepID=A0A9Q8ZDP2_CURCL|nr:hypothetical protein yc1106_07599 [Curvularia clavata]
MSYLWQKLGTRDLHRDDMLSLVRILRDVPLRTEERYERKQEFYKKFTKLDIQDLPRRLRASGRPFGPSHNLCSLHKGLNAYLINDIWAWIKHEFEGAVGGFLYPIIMSGILNKELEWSLRQMEPVLEMWREDFRLDASPPPGREPIQCGDKWCYQQDQCPTCMMARIGSDEKVLFTLFAGLVGRLSSKRAISGASEVPCWKKSGSKRVRFVKYWLGKTNDGQTNLFQAGELGVQLRRWTIEMTESPETLFSNSGTTVSSLTDNSSTVIDGISRPKQDDSKLGPLPRPIGVAQLTPAEDLGFNIPHGPQFPAPASPTLHRKISTSSLYSSTTLSPNDSVSSVGFKPVPLRVAQKQSPNLPDVTENPYHYPCMPTPSAQDFVTNPPPPPETILSYTGGPSERENYTDPLSHPIYNAFAPQAEGIEKYRRLLATNKPHTALPVPKRTSMYFSYWDRKFNEAEFDEVDKEPTKEEREAMEKQVREDKGNGDDTKSSTTQWEDLYRT